MTLNNTNTNILLCFAMKLFEHVYLVKQIIDKTTVMQYILAYST